MNHKDLINTCIFEQIQGLLFSDLSGPLTLDGSADTVRRALFMSSNKFSY